MGNAFTSVGMSRIEDDMDGHEARINVRAR